MQLFGMVGFAEGLASLVIFELWLGTLTVAALALAALALRFSAFAAAAPRLGIAALVADALVAVVYFPWNAFLATPGDDPDWHSLLGAWRAAAAAWCAVSVVAVAVGAVPLWRLVGQVRQELRAWQGAVQGHGAEAVAPAGGTRFLALAACLLLGIGMVLLIRQAAPDAPEAEPV